MTEKAMFFDGVSYTEADQAEFQAGMLRPQGIFKDSPLGELIVAAIAGNMTVTVTNGEANVQGFYYKNTSGVVLTIAANASGSTRIDRVVLRLNRTANTLAATVIQGVPGAGAPALTQVAGGNWDFPLVQITVANGASVISAGNLVDQRVLSQWNVNAINLAATIANLPVALGRISSNGTIITQKNIQSVLDVGNGAYFITFTTPMANVNYIVIAQAINNSNINVFACVGQAMTTTQFIIYMVNTLPTPNTAGEFEFCFAVWAG